MEANLAYSHFCLVPGWACSPVGHRLKDLLFVLVRESLSSLPLARPVQVAVQPRKLLRHSVVIFCRHLLQPDFCVNVHPLDVS